MLRKEEYICQSTGEVLSGHDIVKEILSYETEIKENQNRGLRIRKSKEELQRILDKDYGSFYFLKYKKIIELFTERNKFNGASCFKFIYLATFMNYDNKLCFGGKYGNKHRMPMLEKDLAEVLGISKKQSLLVKKILIEAGAIIVNQDKSLSIAKELCSKGKLSKGYKQESVRVFENAIKELYENSPRRGDRKLARVIKLLPYVNIYHNIVCVNPEEKEASLIKPMNIQDICKALNVSVSHARREENELLKITVAGENALCKYIYDGVETFIINPRIYYKGSNINDLKKISSLFKIDKDI